MIRKYYVFTIFFMVVSSGTVCATNLIEGRLDPNCSSTMVLHEVKEKANKINTPGFSLYIYPKTIPHTYTGCQVAWLENGHKLFTKHLKNGEITWLRGQEPKDVMPFFCLYKHGALNKDLSFNIKRCPVNTKEIN